MPRSGARRLATSAPYQGSCPLRAAFRRWHRDKAPMPEKVSQAHAGALRTALVDACKRYRKGEPTFPVSQNRRAAHSDLRGHEAYCGPQPPCERGRDDSTHSAYKDAPPGLRFWCGATVEKSDIVKPLPWLEWAYDEVKKA